MRHSSSTSNPPLIEVVDLGFVDYVEGRRLQAAAVDRCLSNGTESLIFCEHPPTLTLGRSTRPADYAEVDWAALGVEVVAVDRGGAATFHGPGQLVLYPVIDLRRRELGVKDFVMLGLSCLAEVCQGFGVPAFPSLGGLNPVGLWIGTKKVGSVGLRIHQGITSHGFSLNLDCDLSPFGLFSACGNAPGSSTSLESWAREQRKTPDFSLKIFADRLGAHMGNRLRLSAD